MLINSRYDVRTIKLKENSNLELFEFGYKTSNFDIYVATQMLSLHAYATFIKGLQKIKF